MDERRGVPTTELVLLLLILVSLILFVSLVNSDYRGDSLSDKYCPRCQSQSLVLEDDGWHCGKCGEMRVPK